MAGLLSCFREAFGRRDASKAHKPDRRQPSSRASAKPASETAFQHQARQIAQLPVAGMQRRAGSGPATNFVTTYAPVPARGAGAGAGAGASSALQPPGADDDNATCSTDATLVTNAARHDSGVPGLEKHAAAGGAWKGRPNGTPYDRRQELTEEDEDMWARMAM